MPTQRTWYRKHTFAPTGDGEAAGGQQHQGLALHGPEMIEIEVGDGVASSIVETSKDSHDLYVSKLEAEQVRTAIQKLPEDFREILFFCENMKSSHIRKLRTSSSVPSEP